VAAMREQLGTLGLVLGWDVPYLHVPPNWLEHGVKASLRYAPGTDILYTVGSALRSPRSDAVGPKLACLGVWTVVGMEVESSRNI